EFALVTPGTPDRRKGRLRRLGRSDTFLREKFPVLGERREMIAGVRDQEGAVGVDGLTRRQRYGLRAFDGNARARRGLAHRQIEQPRQRLQVSHREAYVAAPDVGHWNAAAIVGRGHAESVALVEARLQRLHPVASVFMRGAGKTPEATRCIGEFMGRIAPACELQWFRTIVPIV